MFRKILIGGATAAVIVGAGTAALATTGSDTTAGTPGVAASHAGASAKTHDHGLGRKLLRRLAHGQVVLKTRHGFETYDLIRGTVSSVSPTSITVESSDRTSETFVIAKDTTVRGRANGHRSESTIGAVSTGDRVLVVGTGASTFTAKHVIDLGAK